MSICEVKLLPESNTLEVKYYIFTDDLTETLTGSPTNSLPDRIQICNYIQQHSSIKANGTNVPLQFYAIKQKEEQVMVQFYSAPLAQSVTGIAVNSSILTEKFKDQTNVVYVTLPGKGKKTGMLDAKNQEVGFQF